MWKFNPEQDSFTKLLPTGDYLTLLLEGEGYGLYAGRGDRRVGVGCFLDLGAAKAAADDLARGLSLVHHLVDCFGEEVAP